MAGNCSCAGVIDKHFEKEHMDESNERADKCCEPENRGKFAWDDVNNCRLDPARIREAPKAKVEYFQKSTNKKVPVQKCKVVTRNMPIKVR